MAIVKFGGTVTGIRGTLAGTVYSGNKSGPFIRSWAMPPTIVTNAQEAIRRRNTNNAQAWAALSDAQRTAWDTLAANPSMARTNSLGESYNLSGFQMHQSVNNNRLQIGQLYNGNAPSPATVPQIANFNLTVQIPATGDSSFTFLPAELSPNFRLLLFMTFTTSQGVTLRQTNRRWILFVGSGSSSPKVITTELNAALGTPVANYKYFAFVFKQNNNGIRSTAITDTSIAA
jgi:hypothetical protein